MKPVAVLGCGPAGLMAAQACTLAGRSVAILSRPEKSKLGGAQFLHRPIPGINDDEPDATITYRKLGDEATYRQKVYGEEFVPFTSFAGVEDGQTQDAWSLTDTYDRLWEQFVGAINEHALSPRWLDENVDNFDLVLSTIPLPLLCRARAGIVQAFHSFQVQDVKIATEKYVTDIEPNTIVYNGSPAGTWYRASCLFGVHGTEWSDRVNPPVPDLIHDRKPIGTTCDCYKDSVVRLGRRGTWLKGVLTHDAFFGAMEVLK